MGLLDSQSGLLKSIMNQQQQGQQGSLEEIQAPSQEMPQGPAQGMLAGQETSQQQPEEKPVDIEGSGDRMEQDLQKFVTNGMKLLHSEKSRDQTLQMLKSEKPIESVVNLMVKTVQRLDAEARKSGKETHDLVKSQGAAELTAQVIEIGEAAGKFTFTEEEKKLAMGMGVQKYMKEEIAAGRIDPQIMAEQMQNNISQLSEEEKASLDKDLLSIDKSAQGLYSNQWGNENV